MNDNWVKFNLGQVADQISETMGNIHKQIFVLMNYKINNKYWENDYIIAFYSILISRFIQKITKHISSEDHGLILIKVMSTLIPKTYPEFIKRFNIIAREAENENMKLGSNHATDLFCTFEGIPIEPEFINGSHLKKARKFSSKEIYNQVSANTGLNENQRVAMALIEVYVKDYIKKLI